MEKYNISKILLLHYGSLLSDDINNYELSDEVKSELTITLDNGDN